MTGTCASCHEPRVILLRCSDCQRLICAFCAVGPELTCDICYRARPTDQRAALRWYERRGTLGHAPAPEMRAALIERGLIIFSGAGLVLTDAGRAVLEPPEPVCAATGTEAASCDHHEIAEFDLGGEGGFA